ncbi:hypothetical protein AV530_003055 [Patagioenas fasciata monilis]|uniref:Uncharacterized protein n=1 Tax=Patagioenas fasciata monilis TaxID=372326 RepID=A0A1V4KVI7_PATFA|nr:hypothetical protein AV530_003055 [Patagioenas fasciata monilis]
MLFLLQPWAGIVGTNVGCAKEPVEKKEQGSSLGLEILVLVELCCKSGLCRGGCCRNVAPGTWKTLQLCVPFLLAEDPPDPPRFIPSLVAVFYEKDEQLKSISALVC